MARNIAETPSHRLKQASRLVERAVALFVVGAAITKVVVAIGGDVVSAVATALVVLVVVVVSVVVAAVAVVLVPTAAVRVLVAAVAAAAGQLRQPQ